MKQRIVLVSGFGGTGKTTVSNILYEQLENCAVVHADDLFIMKPWEIGEKLGRIKLSNCLAVIRTFLEEGFHYVIVDGLVWSQAEFDAVCDQFILPDCDVLLFWLTASKELRFERVIARAEPGDTLEFLERVERDVRNPWPIEPRSGFVHEIDTSGSMPNMVAQLAIDKLKTLDMDGACLYQLGHNLDCKDNLQIARSWNTTRLLIADSKPDELDALQAVYDACAYIGEWCGQRDDERDQIARSLSGQHLPPDGNPTCHRLQSIYLTENTTKSSLVSGRTLIGYLEVYHGFPSAATFWIAALAIDVPYQHHGYGQELITGLWQQIRRLRCYNEIGLSVSAKNWPALRFWISCGFDQIIKFDGDGVCSDKTFADFWLRKRFSSTVELIAGVPAL